MRTIDLQGIAKSLILPAMNVGISLLAVEFVRPYLDISKETVLGGLSYGALFFLIYLLLLRLTSKRQCREVVHYIPGSSYLQRWLVLRNLRPALSNVHTLPVATNVASPANGRPLGLPSRRTRRIPFHPGFMAALRGSSIFWSGV